MNKLHYIGLFAASILSSQASAAVFNIDSMDITSGNLVRSFNPNDSVTPIELDFTGNTNLVGGFINKDTTTDGLSISQTNFRMVKDPSEPTQYTYTAASNIRHNSEWTGTPPIADGTLSGPRYVVPTGGVMMWLAATGLFKDLRTEHEIKPETNAGFLFRFKAWK